MAKAISLNSRKALTDVRSSDALVGLIKVMPADGSAPEYICTDPAVRLSVDPLQYGLISNGITYRFAIVTLMLPDDVKDQIPSSELEFDNIDPALVDIARLDIFPASLDLSIVRSSEPDDVIETWPALQVTRAAWTIERVTFSVSYDPLTEEPLTTTRMIRNYTPSLFK